LLEKFEKIKLRLPMMPGIFPSGVNPGTFPPASVTVRQTAFVLPFENLSAEAPATYSCPVAKVVSFNDGLIPALANTTPASLAALVIFFAVNYQ